MMTNGALAGAGVEDFDSPDHYWTLPEEARDELRGWVRANVRRARRGERGRWRGTSYGAKHIFEHALGHRHYVSNGAAKQALRLAGFEPRDPDARTWTYRDLIIDASLEEAISP